MTRFKKLCLASAVLVGVLCLETAQGSWWQSLRNDLYSYFWSSKKVVPQPVQQQLQIVQNPQQPATYQGTYTQVILPPEVNIEERKLWSPKKEKDFKSRVTELIDELDELSQKQESSNNLVAEFKKIVDANPAGAAKIRGSTGNEFTALHIAVRLDLRDTVKTLLNRGNADINAWSDFSGATPLILAVQKENRPMIDILVAANKGLDINLADQLKRTALHYAALNGNPEIINRLLVYGANCNLTDAFGKKPANLVKSHKKEAARVLKGCTDPNRSEKAKTVRPPVRIEREDKRWPLREEGKLDDAVFNFLAEQAGSIEMTDTFALYILGVPKSRSVNEYLIKRSLNLDLDREALARIKDARAFITQSYGDLKKLHDTKQGVFKGKNSQKIATVFNAIKEAYLFLIPSATV